MLFAAEIDAHSLGCSNWWTGACVDNAVTRKALFDKIFNCERAVDVKCAFDGLDRCPEE